MAWWLGQPGCFDFLGESDAATASDWVDHGIPEHAHASGERGKCPFCLHLKLKKLIIILMLEAWECDKTMFHVGKIRMSCPKVNVGSKHYIFMASICRKYDPKMLQNM